MKNNYIFIIILSSLVSCTLSWSETNELDVNGKVKKVTKVRVDVKKDSLGNLFNDTAMVTITKLDRKGRLKNQVVKTYRNNEVKQTGIAEYEYNKKGQLVIENYESIEDSRKNKTYYSYQDSFLTKIYSFSYLDNGKLEYSESYYYQPNNKIDFREIMNIGIDTITKDTTYTFIGLLKYDINGYLIQSNWEDLSNGYNKKGIYTNNDKGYLIQEISIDRITNEIDTTRFEYEFDNKNNWILSKSFVNDSLVQITQRIIE